MKTTKRRTTRRRQAKPEARATPENPRFNLNDPEAWETFVGMGEGPTHSGNHVNAETALTFSPYWRGVSLISGTVGKLPLFVYRREGEGKSRDPGHPAYYLLRREPNAEMTADTFLQTLTAHALNHGNGLAYVVRDAGGRPLELIPLLPETSYPVRVNGVLWYVTGVAGEQRKLPAADVLHIKGLGFDGLTGYPLWKKARHSLGLGMAAEEFGARYFSNGAEPSVVIEHPAKVSEKAAANLRNSWNAMHAGLSKAHRAAVLEEGMKLSAFGHNAEDAQLIGTRQFQIREVANWLGIPPHKLGDTARTSFASLEQENQSFLDDAIDPWLVKWERELERKLLTEREKREDTHAVEFLRQALARADLTARANYYRTALGGRPWMTQNEVRGRENMNPVDGGDVILEPLNMGDAGGANNEPAQPDPATPKPAGDDAGDVAGAVRNVLHDAAARMARRLLTGWQRAKDRPAWLAGEMRAEHLDVIARALAPALAAVAATTGRQVEPAALAGELCDAFALLVEPDIPVAHDELERRVAAAVCDAACNGA